MLTQVQIFFHDLNPVAQQKLLHAAGLKNASEGNFDVSPLAVLDFESDPYIPQVGHIVNVSEPPDSNSAWNHEFIGTVKAVNLEEGYATVTDLDENTFDIDFIYLSKDEGEE